jgi:mannan endo-1,4-beta-mannosidase
MAATVLAAPPTAQAQTESGTQAAAGFRLADGGLLDATGKDFVLRGVNHAAPGTPPGRRRP